MLGICVNKNMTIDILFYSENELVARVDMHMSSFYDKFLSIFTDDEISRRTTDGNSCVSTDKEFIRRTWNSCIQHGYVDVGFDTLGYFINRMVVE